MSALDRGGHLSELALDRYRFDPPEAAPELAGSPAPGSEADPQPLRGLPGDPAPVEASSSARRRAFARELRREVEAHLAGCAECRQVVAALETEDAGFALVPPLQLGASVDAPTQDAGHGAEAQVISLAERRAQRRAAWTTGIVVVLAAAAAVLLLARPTELDDPQGEGPDRITLRGSAIDFEIVVDDGHASRLVADGATVHPGERMAFRIKARVDGFLAIVGRDDTGVSYACYPQGAELAAVQAVAVTHAVEPKDLPVALRFDNVVGTERISAVYCATPFTAAEAATLAAEGAAPREGCYVRTLALAKRPIGPDGMGTHGTNGAPR